MSTIIAPDVLRAAAPAAPPSAAQTTDPAGAFAAVLDRTVAVAATAPATVPESSAKADSSDPQSLAPSPGPEALATLLAALVPPPVAPAPAAGEAVEPTPAAGLRTGPAPLPSRELPVAAAAGPTLAQRAPAGAAEVAAIVATAGATVPSQPPRTAAQAAPAEGPAGSPAPLVAADAQSPQQGTIPAPNVAGRPRGSADVAPRSALATIPFAPNITSVGAPAPAALVPTAVIQDGVAPVPSVPNVAIAATSAMPAAPTAPVAAWQAGALERPALGATAAPVRSDAAPAAPAAATVAAAGLPPPGQPAAPQSAGVPVTAVTVRSAEDAPGGDLQPGGADAHLVAALHSVRQAPAGAAPRFEIATPVSSAHWPTELGERILVVPRNQEVELHLRPADLGPLRVRISIQDGQAQLNFVSDSPIVRHTLEAALPQLRSSLAENGINLGQAWVGAGSSEARAQQQNPQDGSAGRHQPQEGMHQRASAPAGADAQHPPDGRAGDGLIDTFA